MDLTSFLPDVYVEATGVPEPVALNALRHTLREFCQASRAWSADLAPISILNADNSYALSLPAGSELAEVLTATLGTRALTVTTLEEMSRANPGWRSATGDDLQAVIPDAAQVLVYPTPNRNLTDTLLLWVSLRPTLSGTTCADVLGRYTEAVALGTLARIKVMPNKPWSDREGVAVYQTRFREGIARARAEALKGFSGASLTVAPRRFGL